MASPIEVTYDRIKETTNLLGIGDIITTGTLPGFKTFASVLNIGDLVSYCIENGTEWEVGQATYTALNTLARTALNVQAGSLGAGVLVNFTGGSKIVFLTGSSAIIRKVINHNCNVHRNQVLVGETVIVPADSFILGLTSFAINGTLDNQGSLHVI